MDPKG
jgi:hypothetical protein